MRNAERGAATLLLSVLLMSVISLIVLASSNYTWFSQKMGSNQYRQSQAFEAAMAGLDYGIKYFDSNHATITANTTNGFIDSYSDSNTSATLGNGSRYTITYTNPVAYNYELILVTSLGLSDDRSASRTVSQLIQSASYLNSLPQVSMIVKGNVSLINNAQLVNTQTDKNILSGGSAVITNSAITTTSTGVTSTSASTGADVTSGDTVLAAQTDSEMFEAYFGVSPEIFKTHADSYYQRNRDRDYSLALAGKTGEIIWIDQNAGEATISSSVQIGTSDSPVILVVNGNLSLVGGARIYGIIFVLGQVTTEFTGSSEVFGSLLSTGNINLKNESDVSYSASILNAIKSQMNYFAKVPGSWKDF